MKSILTSCVCACLLLAASGCRKAADTSQVNGSNESGIEGNASTGNPAPPVGGAAALIAEGVKLFEDYRNDEAMARFKRAAELEPENGEAYYRIGLVYADAGNKEEAQKAYEQAVERLEKVVREDGENVAAQRLFAQAQSRLGNHDEAARAYRQVVKLQPDDSYNHYELGIELSKLAQYPEAVQALKRATQLDPDNSRAVEALERAQEGVKRRDAAIKRQEEELRRQTSSPAAPRPAPSGVVPAPPSLGTNQPANRP